MIIVSDFFGVIVGEIIPNFLKNHNNGIYDPILKDSYCMGSDIGDKTVDDLVFELARDFNMKKEDIEEELMSYAKPNYKYIEFLRNYEGKVILLSNAPEGLVENIIKHLKIEDIFDNTIISYKLKIAKPDIRIYKEVYKYIDKDSKILFIDDNIKNLNPVKELGWNTILYKDFDNFIEEFDKIKKSGN